MTFGFEKALEIMKNGGYVLHDLDVYFLHKGVFYKDVPILDDDENLIYGAGIRKLDGFTANEVLSDEWWQSDKITLLFTS